MHVHAIKGNKYDFFLTIIKGKIKTLNTQVSKEKKSAYTADFFAYVAD